MSIKRVAFKYRKANLRRDAATGLYVGYKIDVRSTTRRHRNLFPTKKEAQDFIDALKQQRLYRKAGMKPQAVDVPTVSRLFAERQKEITNHAAAVRAKRVFAYFSGLLDFDLPVTQVRKSHFKLFIKGRTADGVKPETITREINELSAAFHRASEIFPKQLEDYEPTIARPSVKRGKKHHHEITEAEAIAITETIRTERKKREYPQRVASRPAVALMFELAWILGLRIGESEKLLKSDRNRRANTLRVVRWKTGDVTIFPNLPERAVEILDAAESASSTDRVFEIVCSRRTVESIIREACEANGIKYGRKEVDGITFHSTRHSFASRLVRVTDPATAASLTGHSSLEMLDYYSHASEESRKAALTSLYGKNGNSKLRKIFDKVRAGDLDFEAFLDALK